MKFITINAIMYLKKSIKGKEIFPVLVGFLLLSQLFVGSCTSMSSGSKIHPHNLKCESQIDPLGIDARQPRLNWNLTSDLQNQAQMAFQILVASDSNILKEIKVICGIREKLIPVNPSRSIIQGKRLKAGKDATGKSGYGMRTITSRNGVNLPPGRWVYLVKVIGKENG